MPHEVWREHAEQQADRQGGGPCHEGAGIYSCKSARSHNTWARNTTLPFVSGVTAWTRSASLSASGASAGAALDEVAAAQASSAKKCGAFVHVGLQEVSLPPYHARVGNSRKTLREPAIHCSVSSSK